MGFLRSTVKMDLPEYIVNDVDERLSEDATPQTSQDATGGSNQNMTQYSSEYEILTDPEMDDKYQNETNNTEITIEMGTLFVIPTKY